ncbi:MAG: hypothetical protein RIT81_01690 [Deltaproteobacteria bacterium]
MASTPPKLEVTYGPQPVGRIRFERRPEPPPPDAPSIGLLAFGRAIDASSRDDEAFFLGDVEPVRQLARSLAKTLRPAEHFEDLVRAFESEDPIDLSVGLDRVSLLLSAGDDPDDVLRAALLSSHLVGAFVADDDLDAIVVARILEFGALEGYYYRRASREAKAKLDAHHDFIEALTTIRGRVVDADAPLAIGMRVWEGWQAVRALDRLFGLGSLAAELSARGLVALLRGAEVLLRDTDADAALAHAVAPEAPAAPVAVVPPKPIAPQVPAAPSDPQRPLPAEARAWWIAEGASAPTAKRSVTAVVEDLSSVLERYEILMGGDDNSLVFEVAPMLRANVRALYVELSLGHPVVELGLYLDAPPSRDQVALRLLLARALALDAKLEAAREALARGALNVGYDGA